MKLTNLRAFEKHLAGAAPQKHFSLIYLLLSKDEYDRKAAEDALTGALLGQKKGGDANISLFEGDRLDPGSIMDELETVSMFAGKRAVVVRLSSEKIQKNLSEPLERYFLKPNPSSYLILSAPGVNRATNFYKKAEKNGIVLDIAEEKPWEKERSIAGWIQEKAAAKGKRVEASAVQMLIKQLGTDHATLHQELEKLFCYVGDRNPITVNDINAICTSVNVETGWQLGEALFRKDAPAALRIAKAVLEEGAAVIALLRQIRSQFQTQCSISSILQNGGGPAEVSQRYPYMRGTILEKNLALARTLGIKYLVRGILLIDKTELKAKNSEGDPEFLIELLIVKLTTL